MWTESNKMGAVGMEMVIEAFRMNGIAMEEYVETRKVDSQRI